MNKRADQTTLAVGASTNLPCRLRGRDIRLGRQLLDQLPCPVLWIADDNHLLWVNRSGLEAYGDSARSCYALTHGYSRPCDQEGEPCPKQSALLSGKPSTVEHVHLAKPANAIFEVTAIPVEGLGVLALHVPLGESVVADALTGVFTRRFFEILVRRQLTLLERMEEPFILALVDLDELKEINDSHGHHAGDAALVALSEAIESSIRSADTIGRWGGDEFCLFFPGLQLGSALRLIQRIRRSIHAACLPDGIPETRLTASFGVHSSTFDYDLDAAIREADRALYAAKNLGRDRIEVD